MDAQQLWETTLNPETRMMKRVEIEDARMASDVTEILMGSDVPPRKALSMSMQRMQSWISDNSREKCRSRRAGHP